MVAAPSTQRNFDCSVAGKTVIIEFETDSFPSPVGVGMIEVHEMVGCSGNAICKKFASPQLFRGPDSFGCPGHTSLKMG